MSELAKAINDLRASLIDILFERSAARLAKREVIIQWQDRLVIPGARALALKDDERGVVQLRRGMDDAQTFVSFVHELAHLRLHFFQLADIANINRVPEIREQQGYRYPEGMMLKRSEVHEQQEQEADHLANRWIAYANEHAKNHRLESKLTALMEIVD